MINQQITFQIAQLFAMDAPQLLPLTLPFTGKLPGRGSKPIIGRFDELNGPSVAKEMSGTWRPLSIGTNRNCHVWAKA